MSTKEIRSVESATRLAIVCSLLLVASSGGKLSLAAGKTDSRNGVPVRIEILPGERAKWIDPVLSEPVPVAVFGGKELDVREIDPATLVLAGSAVMKNDDGSLGSYRDVDQDGVMDLIVKFASRQLRLGEQSTQAFLSGRTTDGRLIQGSGSIATLEKARAERRLAAPRNKELEKLPPLRVQIDVLPGDPSNRIELGNRGTVAVAVLSAPGFDATQLDPTALLLAGSPVTRRKNGGLSSLQDVNADGLADLVVEVPRKLLRLQAGAREAVLTGFTPEGRFITGSDRISLAESAVLTFDSDDPKAPLRPASVEFVNDGAITINDAAAASPYPSTIAVAGLPGVVSKVRVTLKNVTHTFPRDLDILLVGPTGQSLVLMSDAGGINPGVSNVTLTFDDDSAFALDPSVNPGTGTYRPANFEAGDTFPAPAPAPTAATTLQAFGSTNPNGTWSLYVLDDFAGDSGVIAGGWSLDFELASEFCNAGPITINDATTATPYPSSVAVAGLTGIVSKLTVVLKGLTHSNPIDVDALLVAPAGQRSIVISDAGGIGPGLSGATLVLDDDAPFGLDMGINPQSGTYRPTDFFPGDSFPAPAPVGPYPANFNVFEGIPANGTWNLYVVDDVGGDTGSLTRFCLDITTMTPIDDSNLASITIPSGAPGTTSGPASLYPSTIDVSGVIGTLATATVAVRGLTHTFPADLDVLLTSPTGGNVLLMSDVGGGQPGVSGVTYTFDDSAPSSIPAGVNRPTGTYKPSNDDSGGPDAMPAPAPGGPYGSTLSSLAGLSPDGTWGLYVFDDTGGDVGSIASGWTLTLRTWLTPYGGCVTTNMNIPAGAPGTTQGPSSAYPSGIIELLVPVDMDQYKVHVDLQGLSHSYPRDLDVLLVGPQGQSVMLMSDTGGNGPGVSNVDLSFDDDAGSTFSQLVNPGSGTYKPIDTEPGDSLPAPAPAAPYGTSLAVFKGTNPLGGWALYVADDAGGDVGSLTGWCLRFLPSLGALDVPNLRFTSKNTVVWDAGANATSYNLYRGDPGQLPSLVDHGNDSCLRDATQTPVQRLTSLVEVPAAGSFYWYLVRGNNAQGEGPAGFERFRGLVLARVQDSSGVCP